MKRNGAVIWGILFILLGLCFAGNALDLWSFDLFFDGWWTLFIIIPCAVSVVQDGPRVANGIFLVVGILLLLSAQNIIHYRLIGRLILPAVFVAIGLSILFRGTFLRRAAKARVVSSGMGCEYTSVFGAQQVRYPNEDMNGGDLTAVFGGIELDLRSAVITQDIVIHVTAVFGGVDIWLPANVRAKISTIPIFGGVNNKTASPLDPNAPTVYIDAVCIFGGVDLK